MPSPILAYFRFPFGPGFRDTTSLGWCIVVADIILAAVIPVVLAWMALAIREGTSSIARTSSLASLVAAFLALPVLFFLNQHIGFDAMSSLAYGVSLGFVFGLTSSIVLAYLKTRARRFAALVALWNLCLVGCVIVAVFGAYAIT